MALSSIFSSLTLVKGDIQEIHWVLYTRKPKDESALQNQVSSEEEKDSAHLLQLAEYILREDGGHALLDKNKAGVWVFSLSQALDKGTAQKLGLDYLESKLTIILYCVCPLTGCDSHISRMCALRRFVCCYESQRVCSTLDQSSALLPSNRCSNWRAEHTSCGLEREHKYTTHHQ